MQNKLQSINTHILNGLIVFACFSISMPTAWMSIATGLILIFWILSGRFSEKFNRILNNPVAMGASILLLIYFAAMFYSSASWDMRRLFLLKYIKLLLIPVVISSVNSERIREISLQAFLLGIFILLSISYMKWLHILPLDMGIHDIYSPGQGYTVFKNRIAHNILLSFAMYLMLCKFLVNKTAIRWVWLSLAFLTFFNIMYLVTGRTGQLIALVLLVFFFFKRWGIKSIIGLIGLSLIFWSFKSHLPYELIPERLQGTSKEIQAFSNQNVTSAGLRFEMYKNCMIMIRESPWIGHGTGALKEAYEKFAKTHNAATDNVPNPHNQYLLTLFELGLFGFGFLIIMYYQIWKSSNQKPFLINYRGELIQALLITFIIGSLFNSLLLDATEGKFFCLMIGLFFSAYLAKPKKSLIRYLDDLKRKWLKYKNE